MYIYIYINIHTFAGKVLHAIRMSTAVWGAVEQTGCSLARHWHIRFQSFACRSQIQPDPPPCTKPPSMTYAMTYRVPTRASGGGGGGVKASHCVRIALEHGIV